jgi:hypothetical protein
MSDPFNKEESKRKRKQKRRNKSEGEKGIMWRRPQPSVVLAKNYRV